MEIYRFAPSPNGPLHLGHAYSALLNFELARGTGGRFLLRIEDIDAARSRPEFEAAILADLAWLGLSWEEPVRRQSEHFPVYRAAIDRLRAEGLVYPAFLSRREIDERVAAAERQSAQPWPRDPDGAPHYPGDDRTLAPAAAGELIGSGRPFTWRLEMAAALARSGPLSWAELGEKGGGNSEVVADPAAWGDVVLGRRDAPASYHLAVVLDDAEAGITDIVRGADLFQATSIHRLLQTLFGLPAPRYRHHRLILGADGRKLAKSEGSTGLAELRAGGATPADIRRLVGLDEDLAGLRLEPV